MAISIIFGPGGSGKSLFQMYVIVRELRTSRRNICTNLALNVPQFNAYLEKKYPHESLNLVDRLRLLTPDETKQFWKYRGPSKWVISEGNCIDQIDDKGADGVAYIIDEAGASGFSAQEWAQTTGRAPRGVECTWYLDQQRKFGDNVYASANGRAPTSIAKGFRDKAHDFTKLRNGYLRKMGIFKAQGKFTRLSYTAEPGPNSEPYERADFVLDVELANCYRTQDGIGVHGNKADIGSRAKGIPIIMVFPIAIGLGMLCIAVPWFLGKSFSGSVAKPVKAAAVEAGSKLSAAAVAAVRPIVTGTVLRDDGLYVALFGRGWLRVEEKTERGVRLSDGTVIPKHDALTGGGLRAAGVDLVEPKK